MSAQTKENLSVDGEIELLPCSLKFHEFEDADLSMKCHITTMQDSLYLWVGNANNQMNDLHMAFLSKYDNLPTSTKIMGPTSEIVSATIAKRLSKKIGKLVYVSFSMPVTNFSMGLIEKRIHEEFATNPTILDF